MAITEKIKSYLDKRHIIYDVNELPPFASLLQAAESGGVSPAAIAKSIVLKDELGFVLVVVPATHGVDGIALSKLMYRKMELVDDAQIKQAFPDCLPRFIPPLGEAYGIRTIVDDALMGLPRVYFPVGDASSLIQVSGKVFFNLLNGAWLAGNFASPITVQAFDAPAKNEFRESETDGEIKRRVQQLADLPAMPQLAIKLVELRADPDADAEKLGKLIELDPSLAAQVIRYARSPFFFYRGSIDSIQTAISRVLGFEMVMNMALGIATARPFKIPVIGPLGLNAFWRHAIHSAALVQALGREMPQSMRPSAGLSYLAGLLHNFGFLLLGHLFKSEFCILNGAISDNPETSILERERAMLGVEHGELGAWLLERWDIPEEIITAVRHHHQEDYDGPHAAYPALVLLADRMLKGHGIGDAPTHEIPEHLLQKLGLKEIQTVMVMGRILEGVEGLNVMARNLAAAS
jgi:HD-like signal output (HDOD) protein/prolyl-tRNA editing enzyme YbaK/EbsC (Cys-tRNA(Pro) deacylase)